MQIDCEVSSSLLFDVLNKVISGFDFVFLLLPRRFLQLGALRLGLKLNIKIPIWQLY